MSLSVSGLNFFYRDNQVLNDVCFEIQKGELVSILGPNGVGKTTLLKCINAMLRGVSGEILLDNQNIRSLSPTEIAGAIAYVPQRCETARMTVFDTVLLGRKPYFRWCVGKRDLKIVESALRQLQLSHLSLRHIDQLSGGELQKVSVARALVQEPRLLLLDEPTSALDLKSQVEILERLKHIVSVHNMSALMTMHDLNTALRVSDQVVFLKNGRVWFKGIPADVTSMLVSDVYDVPVQMHNVNGHPMVVPVVVLSQKDTDNVLQFQPKTN